MTGAATQRVYQVMLVDDAQALRSLVKSHLNKTTNFHVAAEAADGQAAVHLAHDVRPDIILLDLSMPVMDGLTALPLLRAELPAAAIVIFSTVEHPDLVRAVTAGGADAVIEKGTPLSELVVQLTQLASYTVAQSL